MKLLLTLILLSQMAMANENFNDEQNELRGQGERRGPPEMSEEMHEALRACHQETGVERPQRGERPSEEDRAKMDTCLKEKGITLPKRRAPGGASRS